MKKFILALSLLSLTVLAQSTNSPNMNLPIPIVGQTTGPAWANNINASLLRIDSHDHTPGNGVQITPSGLNINANLPFANNSATGLQATVYTPQGSYSTDYGVHVEGVDLYYVDGNGNDIRMTSGGTVNATSSGISSGTATASFVASQLVVNAASTTPANIKAGSYLMGNNTAGSNYLTIQPPNAMAASYSITMPSLPGAQSFLAMDTSGNITGFAAVAAGITGSMIAPTTVAASNIVNNTITTSQISATAGILPSQLSTTPVTGNILINGGGTQTITATTYTVLGALGHQTLNYTPVVGRPIFITYFPNGGADTDGFSFTSTSGAGVYTIFVKVATGTANYFNEMSMVATGVQTIRIPWTFFPPIVFDSTSGASTIQIFMRQTGGGSIAGTNFTFSMVQL